MDRLSKAGLTAVLVCMLAPSLAAAHDYKAGALAIGHPWTRATPAGASVAGGYLTIINQGSDADTLTGGSLQAAKATTMHDMATVDGVMTMRAIGPLVIPPGATVTLSPSGHHFMFTGLTRRLVQGEMVPGTLVFDHAGTVPVSFAVEAIGAKVPGEHGGHAMPDPTMK